MSTRRFRLVGIFAVLLAAGAAIACSKATKEVMTVVEKALKPDPPLRVDIVRSGLVEQVYSGEVESAPDSATGVVTLTEDVRYIEETDRIPARLGTSFSIDYMVLGGGGPLEIELEMRTVHPPMRNPDTGRVSTLSRWTTTARKYQVRGRSYTLEYDWEVVPGDWAFEIYHDDVLLARQDFVLYAVDE